jgi:hypothetical protein
MRISFRKSAISRTQRDRVLFIAPIIVAVILLFLFAQNKAVFASAWRSPLAVLADRSPGSRTAGALYNIKPDHLAKATRLSPPLAVPPAERVLAVTRERVPPFAGLLPAGATPLNLMDEGAPALAGLEPMDLGIPGVAPFSAPPPGSPPGPGCCIPQLDEEPTPPAPVPEPTTWAMNIFGLFLIGGALRYRNRKLRAAKPGSALLLQA